jgi:hypothetical protein
VEFSRPRSKEALQIPNQVPIGNVRNESQGAAEIDPLVAWIGLESSMPQTSDTSQHLLTREMLQRMNTYKCPSVISEPRWIAHSYAASTIGLQSAPSEYFGSSRAIRKLRPCLRCKFLKKTCDKGEPCAGCQPSLTRLWEVPCTRIPIECLDYFMDDWLTNCKAWDSSWDFLISPNFCDRAEERIMLVSHGYGISMEIMVFDDHSTDEIRYCAQWSEGLLDCKDPIEMEIQADRLDLTHCGLSPKILAGYLDKHLDAPYAWLVNFSRLAFIPEALKTIHKYYTMQPSEHIREALKLILCYDLAKCTTTLEQTGTENLSTGYILNPQSRYYGRITTPQSINTKIRVALTKEWKGLQIRILERLSALYSGVHSGRHLEHWFEILLLSSVLLIVWEEMLYDYAHHVKDERTVNEFWRKVKSIPVNVIIGLFAAISEQLPPFSEWDTRRHGQLLNNNVAMCEAMSEMRAHVVQHGKQHCLNTDSILMLTCTIEAYLRSIKDAPYDRSKFESLSNVFLSRLFLRSTISGGGV